MHTVIEDCGQGKGKAQPVEKPTEGFHDTQF